MKLKSISRSLAACGLVCLIASNLTCCSDSTTSEALTTSVSGSGPGGGSAEGGAAPSLVCGKRSAFSECDPLTASPCDVAANETCDYDFVTLTFHCVAWSKVQSAGEACGDPLNCGATTTCNIAIEKCQHYCCSDSDCLQGSCAFPGVFVDGDAESGVCADEFVDAAGAGGEGG